MNIFLHFDNSLQIIDVTMGEVDWLHQVIKNIFDEFLNIY